jgi:tRNA 2-thiouridine synthesizing protein A
MEYQHLLDTEGLYCPEPIMMLHAKVREAELGDVIKLIASDPATTRDVPKFCNFLPHELIKTEQQGELFHYFIRVGG